MKWLKVFGLAAAGVLLALGLASCGQGLSVQEAEMIKEELQDVTSRLTAIERDIQALTDMDGDELAEAADGSLENLAQEITQISSRLTDIEAGIEIPEVPEDEPMPAEPAGDPGGF